MTHPHGAGVSDEARSLALEMVESHYENHREWKVAKAYLDLRQRFSEAHSAIEERGFAQASLAASIIYIADQRDSARDERDALQGVLTACTPSPALGDSWDPRKRLAYVFEQLELILPCLDDNRPIEAHARKVVAKHKADVVYAQHMQEALVFIAEHSGDSGLRRVAHAALAKNPNPSGQSRAEPSGHLSPEGSGPVGLGPLPALALAGGFGDPETLFNSRDWLKKAIEAKGAKVTGAGVGCGQADLDFTLEGCKFNVSLRPIK